MKQKNKILKFWKYQSMNGRYIGIGLRKAMLADL